MTRAKTRFRDLTGILDESVSNVAPEPDSRRNATTGSGTRTYLAVVAALLTVAVIVAVIFAVVHAVSRPSWQPTAQTCSAPASLSADQLGQCIAWNSQHG